MPLPTLTRSWSWTPNVEVPSQSSWQDLGREMTYRLIDWLRTNGWTVQSSSNGTTASASDLWTDRTKLNWHYDGNPRSWIVLRNNDIGTNYDICFDLGSNWGPFSNGNSSAQLRMYVATKGYSTTSLNTSNRPAVATAGDAEFNVFWSFDRIEPWYGGWHQINTPMLFNFMKSTTNDSYRIFVYHNDLLSAQLIIEKAGNPSAVWTTASPTGQAFAYMSSRYNGGNLDIGGPMWSNGILYTRIGTVSTGLRTSVESYNGGWVTQGIVNDQTNEYPLVPMGLVCTSAPYRMRIGNIVDMYHTQISLPNGTTFPNDGSRKFLQLGNIVIPWGDGTTHGGPILKTRLP